MIPAINVTAVPPPRTPMDRHIPVPKTRADTTPITSETASGKSFTFCQVFKSHNLWSILNGIFVRDCLCIDFVCVHLKLPPIWFCNFNIAWIICKLNNTEARKCWFEAGNSFSQLQILSPLDICIYYTMETTCFQYRLISPDLNQGRKEVRFYGVLALSGYGVLEKTLKEKATKALTLQRKGKYIHYLC